MFICIISIAVNIIVGSRGPAGREAEADAALVGTEGGAVEGVVAA